MAVRLSDRMCLGPQDQQNILKGISKNHRQKSHGRMPRYKQLDEDTYRIISSWWHYAILSMFEAPEFDGDAAQISARLRISLVETKRALKRLERIGLLTRSPNQKLIWSGKNISTSDDIASVSIKKSHIETLELAGKSLNRDNVSIREFSAVTMLIDPEQIPTAKKMIREFRDKLSALLESGSRERVYRLAIQLFPMSDILETVRDNE
jgi:uncharacterized protein (TIGR02147 family)